jgi:isopentenyl-diphosphate delta-isomerase
MDVQLVDEQGRVIGTAPKAEVHSRTTPLHLAFSCYLLDDEGRIILTRRSLEKQTWPGVWTNSFCGHPQPGESFRDALNRHALGELGIRLDSEPQEVLPDFRYRAVDASGIVENEICPVFVARSSSPVEPQPREVAETAAIDLSDLQAALASAPFAFSPWMQWQLDDVRLVQALDAASRGRA